MTLDLKGLTGECRWVWIQRGPLFQAPPTTLVESSDCFVLNEMIRLRRAIKESMNIEKELHAYVNKCV